MTDTRKVAVVAGNRIPFARQDKTYRHASNSDMLTAAINGLVDRTGLGGQELGEVVAGAVLKHARDWNMVREVVLGSKLAPTTPAYDIQQACGTGLEAAILVANKIALGQIDAGIAGGVDTASDAPIAVNDKLRKILLDLNRARPSGPAQGAGARKPEGRRAGDPAQRRAADRQVDGRPRGADGAGVGHHPGGAGRAGVPLPRQPGSGVRPRLPTGPDHAVPRAREGPEPPADTTLEKLAKLKTVYGKGETATMTAGNSTPLTDGASAVLLRPTSGPRSTAPAARVPDPLADRRGRLREGCRGAADGARVRRTAHAGAAPG